MPSYVPPKRATAFRFWVSLVSQSDTKLMQVNPTLAAGDVQVSKDGGALANLTTLPAVAPASSGLVQVDLSATEMTADNVTVVFADAAGAQWCDLVINIQTAARQVDDLTFPNTSGRGIDVNTTGGVEVGSVDVGAITAGSFAAGAIDNAAFNVTETLTANPATGGITATSFAAGAIDAAAIATDAIGSAEFSQAAADKVWSTTTRAITDKAGFSLSAAGIQAIWDALTSALTTASSIGKLLVDNVNATISSRSTVTTAQVNAEVVDALNVDTYAEPGQGTPAATTTLVAKIGYLYKFLRNRVTQTATTLSIYNDDALTVDQKATVSDNGTTFERTEITTGP